MATPYFRVEGKLEKATDIAIREVLAVKKREHVLIITNPIEDVYKISQDLYAACIKVRATPTLIV